MFRTEPAPEEPALSPLLSCFSALRNLLSFIFCFGSPGQSSWLSFSESTPQESGSPYHQAPSPLVAALAVGPSTPSGRRSPEAPEQESSSLIPKGQASSSDREQPVHGFRRARHGHRGFVDGKVQQRTPSLEDLNRKAAAKDLTSFDEDDMKKSSKRVPSALSLAGIDDEEICPTCLDPYTDDNPAISTTCQHHFHLGCLLEWQERSNLCPMCGIEMSWQEL